jgi:hypothetical protein
MQIVEIDLESPAGRELAALVRDPKVYRIRIAPDHGGPGTVAIKANESMWSPALSTEVAADHFSRPLTECGNYACGPETGMDNGVCRACGWTA